MRGRLKPSAFVPLDRLSYDPSFRPLEGYELGPGGEGEPVWSRLKASVYPVLDLCLDAYYASLSKSFQGKIEFVHHVQAAMEFIHEGADVDVRDDQSGGSCLHFAAGSGSLELCRTLLSAKARLHSRDIHLQTPLWWAISGNHRTSTVRCLYGSMARFLYQVWTLELPIEQIEVEIQ